MKKKKQVLNSLSSRQKFSPILTSIFSRCGGVFLALILSTGVLFGQQHGLEIETNNESLQNDAIRVKYARSSGIHIDSSSNNGIFIRNTAGHGIDINHAGNEGVYVNSAGGDGIKVERAVGYSMNIRGEKSINNSPEAHIAEIRNLSQETQADVLSLVVGRLTNIGSDNHFISFFEGDHFPLGSVRGNGSGGVEYATSGADYAECLPMMDQSVSFQPGDLVGVHAGKISHDTKGATQVMVVTDQAAVLGNMSSDQEDGSRPVSFIGQIPVWVRGTVQAGDWIVPDGNQQGIGVAIPASAVTTSHKIVGRAWESSTDPGIKRVNTAVGLDQSEALMQMIQRQQEQIDQLQQEIMNLKEKT
jgi:hypothetical protein